MISHLRLMLCIQTVRTRAWRLLVLLCCLGSIGDFPSLAEATTDAECDLDALTALNGLTGFGDVSKIEAERTIVAPGNRLGFSLKVTWESHPGSEGFWSIRAILPSGTAVEEYDRFACDLYVESSDDVATLAIFPVESDGDRWVCWSQPLSKVPAGQWQHIEVKREQMSPWLLGNGKQEWNRIECLAVEPSRGKAVFYVDNLCLIGPNGRRQEFVTAADDGLRVDQHRHEPIAIPEPGTVYFPGLSRPELLEGGTPRQFRELLGSFGTSAFGESAVQSLQQAGITPIYYSAFGEGYMKFLTRRQAWDVTVRGESPNVTSFFTKTFNGFHTFALAHPAVTEAGRQRVDALVASGIGAWMIVDYTFPYTDGPFGYSPAMRQAYVADLNGDDEGLFTRENGAERVVRFRDYFLAYNGFFPNPSDLGLKSWEEFSPPQLGQQDVHSQACGELFLYLRSYEWLKLPDRVGRYSQSRGGQGVWVAPNPEDTNGSSDYAFMARSVGVRNLFPEWFGNVGYESEAGYASLPYLREQADSAGSRLSGIYETGAGGHAAPYWDWRVAYNGVYALTAASRADDLDNDFLDETNYAQMADPAKTAQFVRFRDGVAKAKAFQQSRAEKATRPGAKILGIAERPPARACNSIFFGLQQPYNLAIGISRAHFVFDLRDSLDLDRVLDRYDVLSYSPCSPREGDMERIRRWLDEQPDHLLIAHTFVPTRSAREWWGMDRSARLGRANGGDSLGLGRIATSEVTRCVITSADDQWVGQFPPGQTIELASPLTRCEHGEPLVSTDAGPLVSRVRVGKGQVIYLHYSAEDPANPAVLSLNIRVMLAIGKLVGVRPICTADADTLVQVFDVPGGQSVVAWDRPTLDKWVFEYRPGIEPLRFESSGVDRTVRLTTAGDARWLAYDFWADRLTELPAGQREASLHLENAVTGLFYVGADTPTLRATIANAQKVRQEMRDLKFETTP